MATYVNNVVWKEDGYGDVHVRFVVSDSYSGLFLPDSDGDVAQVNCIEIDSIKKGLQSGVQATDEVQFSIAAAALIDVEDTDCLSFILDAQDTATKRYIATFIQPTATPRNVDIDFIGVVSPEQEATDLRWSGSLYSTAVTPVRNWKFVSRPYQIELFDSYTIEDLVTNATDGIESVGSTWVSDHVASRQGYFHDVFEGTTRDAKWVNLVNLNSVLDKLTRIVEARMRALLGEPHFTITIEGAASPFKLTPTRFSSYINPSQHISTRYVENVKFRSTDARQVYLGGSHTDAESPWVHWALFHPPASAKDLSSWDKCKTYTGLIFHLAYCFGMHVEFVYASIIDLHIKFVPMSSFARTQTCPADVTSASVKVAPIKAGSSGLVRTINRSSEFSLEGSNSQGGRPDQYHLNQYTEFVAGMVSPSLNFSTTPSTNPLLLSIAPTLRLQTYGEDGGTSTSSPGRYAYLLQKGLRIPHNAAFFDNGSIKHQADPDYYKDDCYAATVPVENHIHTGIFLCVTGVQEVESHTVGGGTAYWHWDYGVDGQTIWAPAGLVHFDDSTFDKLCDVVNNLSGVVTDAQYESKYTLTVPYVCRFSTSVAGTDDDWRNLTAGSIITLDGVDFVVTGFERSIRNRTTKLDLYSASRFSFAVSSGLASPLIGGDLPTALIFGTETPTPRFTSDVIFDTAAAVGDALAMMDNGHVVKMQASAPHYGRFIGCAMTDVPLGGTGNIALVGETISSSNYSFVHLGQRAYLRTSAPVTCNVRSKDDELRQRHGLEELHLSVGYAIAADTIKILPTEHWLFT